MNNTSKVESSFLWDPCNYIKNLQESSMDIMEILFNNNNSFILSYYKEVKVFLFNSIDDLNPSNIKLLVFNYMIHNSHLRYSPEKFKNDYLKCEKYLLSYSMQKAIKESALLNVNP